MSGALQIYAADQRAGKGPSAFPSPPNDTACPGRWTWSWHCCLQGAAWQQFGLLLEKSLALPSSSMLLLQAGMVLLGAGPSFCSSCLRSTSQWKPAHSPQLPQVLCHAHWSGFSSNVPCPGNLSPSGWHLCPVNCKVTSQFSSSCCECGVCLWFLASLAQPPLGD